MLTRFKCGHIGRMTTGKTKAFIRFAEIRRWKVEPSDKQCPDCRKGDNESGNG